MAKRSVAGRQGPAAERAAGRGAWEGEHATLAEVAGTVLQRDLSTLLLHHVRILAGADARSVHDMRVTTRRLRAALRLFADAVPVPAPSLGVELGWLSGRLGAVRDLDVQLAAAARWRRRLPDGHVGGVDEVIGVLARQRGEALGDLLQALDSERCAALTLGLGRLADTMRAERGATVPVAAAVPAAKVLPRRIRAAHRRAVVARRRARKRGRARDLHRLRIRCKQLRYGIELASELYPSTAPAAVSRIAALQDRLGALQDDVVLIARLRALLEADRTALSPQAALVVGVLADRLEHRANRGLQRMPDRLGGLGGRAWRALRDDMRDRARRCEVADPPGTSDPGPD